jgi:hypothetical protein
MTRRYYFTLLAGLLLVLLTLFWPAAAAGQENLDLEIISPSNGEIFYASKLGYIVAIPVSGRVSAADLPPETIAVQLALHTAHGEPLILHTQPDEHGFFVFHLDLNPDNLPLPTVGERFFEYSVHCPDCHFSGAAELPLGELLLAVTAMHPDGFQVTAERRVTVDRSELAHLPVQVQLHDGADFALEDIPVQAETRLYEWRGRLFRELTDQDGRVNLRLERLTQRGTHYWLTVPPTLINNRRYQSVAPVEVVLTPGGGDLAPLILHVTVENGRIAGRVQPPDNSSALAAGWPILAIAQPSGHLYQQKLPDDQQFTFTGLPLGHYLLALDSVAAEHGWTAEPTQVNLLDEAAVEVTLNLQPKHSGDLSGRLVDKEGHPLPFAWFSAPGQGTIGQVSPLAGQFVLPQLQQSAEKIRVTVPGFWSETITLTDPMEQTIRLQSRPDSQHISWGSGQITIPAESVVETSGAAPSLVRGWIWGHNQQPDPFLIQLERAELKLEAADFALEYTPGEPSWLYVNEGQALFTGREGLTQQINAGKMMAFGDGVPSPAPVPAAEQTVRLLRADRDPTVPLTYSPRPTLWQRAGRTLAQFGRNLIQIIVAATYLLILILPVAAFIYGFWRLSIGRKHK